MTIPKYEFDIVTDVDGIKVVAKAFMAYFCHKIQLLEPYSVNEVPAYIASFAIGYHQQKLVNSSREDLYQESLERVKSVYRDYKSILDNLPKLREVYAKIKPEILAASQKCHDFDIWRCNEERKAGELFKNGKMTQKEYQLFLKLLREEAEQLSSKVSHISRDFTRKYFPFTHFEEVDLWSLIKNEN